MKNNFQDILYEFLKSNEISQTDFARAIKIKPSQVCEWLRGKSKPSYDMLKKICLTLDISADYFLGITETF